MSLFPKKQTTLKSFAPFHTINKRQRIPPQFIPKAISCKPKMIPMKKSEHIFLPKLQGNPHSNEIPAFLKQLQPICPHTHNQPFPVAMIFIGQGTSHQGSAMAVYACPMCGWREGYVQHNRTQEVMQLWGGFPK